MIIFQTGNIVGGNYWDFVIIFLKFKDWGFCQKIDMRKKPEPNILLIELERYSYQCANN